jgi:pyruvate dehydrogenase E1 component alpha subunit
MSDPAKYRTREEVDEWMQRDPIAILGARIQTLGIATPGQLETIDTEAKATIQDAVRFAETSPEPEAGTVLDHVEA